MKPGLAKEAGAAALLVALLAAVAWYSTRSSQPEAEPELHCSDLVELVNEAGSGGVFCASRQEQLESVLAPLGLEECQSTVVSLSKGPYPMMLRLAGDCTLLERLDGRIRGETSVLLGRPLDVNTATAEDLTAVPDIGRHLSLAIVQEREQNGHFCPFSTLTRVKGIGDKKLELFGKYLMAGGCRQ